MPEHPREWWGCYKGQHDLWTAESYAHPAKASPALAFRILEHLEELGLLPEGATILDPMGGIGTFVLAAALKGHPATMVELEPKFVKLAQANADRLALKGFGAPITIIKGDARHLSELIKGQAVGVMSPPYLESQKGGGISARKRGEGDYPLTTKLPGNIYQPLEAGQSPDQIASLPDYVGVTSPPYEDSDNRNPSSQVLGEGGAKPKVYVNPEAEGQIGQEKGETYLSAMAQVYAECAKLCPVLVVVTKNPTRNGKLRRLDLDTIALLEKCGYKIICRHRAMLFEEEEKTDLFGETTKKPKGRLSFFKRLSYQKGSPVADHEDVLFCVKDGQ